MSPAQAIRKAVEGPGEAVDRTQVPGIGGLFVRGEAGEWLGVGGVGGYVRCSQRQYKAVGALGPWDGLNYPGPHSAPKFMG